MSEAWWRSKETKALTLPTPIVARWFPSTSSYYSTLACALSRAREQIFIQGWWLVPEVELCPGLPLSSLLIAAAARGVDVYVLVYREVDSSFFGPRMPHASSRVCRLLNGELNARAAAAAAAVAGAAGTASESGGEGDGRRCGVIRALR